MIYLRNVSFKELNSLHVDTLIKHFFVVNNVNDIYVLLYLFKYFNIDYYILGNASKILFCKEVIYKPIIYNNLCFEEIIYLNDKVLVSSATSIQKVIISLSKLDYGGFETLYAIPGNIGGCCYMNAGDNNVSISKFIEGIYILDEHLNLKYLDNKMCEFSYRNSLFKRNNYYILYALLKYKKSDKNTILNNIKNALIYRYKVQEINKYTCGSLFKNTNDYKAYELLKKINANNITYNGAHMSNKHLNFLINDGYAKGKDIINLINDIKKTIYKNYHISLELELNLFK
ncbi:MAG: UDP-N-acetylmuramate dehydrogenase [Erysipelotrichaceae bacterium]|nr:UDP-N-acetylmuramate dehydrogenase [Erysipelotrichaceae bacterium]